MTWSRNKCNADNGPSIDSAMDYINTMKKVYQEIHMVMVHIISNEDTTWGGGGTNNGYRRIARDAGNGIHVWLR